MQYKVEVFTKFKKEPILVLTNPPTPIMVGDIIAGEENKIYRVVQRAFIVTTSPISISGKKPEPMLVIQCAATDVTHVSGNDEEM